MPNIYELGLFYETGVKLRLLIMDKIVDIKVDLI